MPAYANRGVNLDKLKESWQRRVAEAFYCYLHALNQHRRIKAELDRGHISLADGAFAVLKARRLTGMALNQLIDAERIYRDLLLGKGIPGPPDENEKPLL